MTMAETKAPTLKSLAEIAFDAYQCFAAESSKFPLGFNDLNSLDKLMFERIAGRVYAEVLLRQNPDKVTVEMPNLDI
jgi:hypothetical protein